MHDNDLNGVLSARRLLNFTKTDGLSNSFTRAIWLGYKKQQPCSLTAHLKLLGFVFLFFLGGTGDEQADGLVDPPAPHDALSWVSV